MDEISFKSTKVFFDIWEAVTSKKYKLIEEQGGSRSSKTWSNFQVIFLDAYQNPMTKVTILRETQKSCREIVEEDWIKWLSDPKTRKIELEKGLITQDEFTNFIEQESLLKYFIRNKSNHTWTFIHNNSFLRFTGLDDENDAMGMTQDICWVNEPYVFGHDVYLQLNQRTSRYILFDWNPKQNHWIDTERLKNDTITLKSTLLDNPFCPKESRKQILSYQPLSYCSVVLSEKIDEQECYSYDLDKNKLGFTKKELLELKRCIYNEETKSAKAFNWQVYGLGEKAEKPNRIFNWKPIDFSEYLKIDVPKYIGVDWGKVDPFGILEAKYLDGKLYLHELNYDSENVIRERLNSTQLSVVKSDDLETNGETGIVKVVFSNLNIDKRNPIICDNNRPIKIACLRRMGFDAYEASKPKGSILDGIDVLDNLEVYYTRESKNLEYEQENYSRKVDRYGIILDEPEDVNNHLIDPARYVAQYLVSKGVIKSF